MAESRRSRRISGYEQWHADRYAGWGKIVSFCGLYEQDPQLYCSLIIARAEEMTRKYQKLYRACGNRLAPYAAMVYNYLGDRFDDSAYQKMRRSLENKMQICDKLRAVYLKNRNG